MSQTTAEGASLSTVLIPGIVQHHQDGRDALFSFAQECFEIQQCCFVTGLVDKCGGDTGFSRTAGTSNPVHVVFNFRGHVKVNDVLNGWKIKPFGGNITV